MFAEGKIFSQLQNFSTEKEGKFLSGPGNIVWGARTYGSLGLVTPMRA